MKFWDARQRALDEPGNLFHGPMGPVLLNGVDVTDRCVRIEFHDDGTQLVELYSTDSQGRYIVEDGRVVTERRFGAVTFPD